MAISKKVFQCVKHLFNPTQASTCELYKGCKSPYMSRSGSKDAEILLIGEAPGQQEDEQGKPFVGDSGKLLRHALALAGVTDFAITNSVRCRPPGNRDPKMSEIRTCKSFLDEDITSMPNLKLLVLLGNHAMMSIMGHKGILEASGTYSTLVHDDKEYGMLCVMHPSYVLQNPKELNNFNNHIGRIPNAVTGALTDSSDEGTYHTITTYAEWQELVAKIRKAGMFVYDIETNSLDPYPSTSQITCMSFSVVPREAYVVEMTNMGVFPFLVDDLQQIMTDKSIGKIGQNIKFDNLWLNVKWNIPVKGTIWDTSIAQFLLDENESHGLKSMAWKYTRLGGYDQILVRGEPHMATGANLLKYSCMDADITNRIFAIQKPKIEADKGLKFLNETLMIPVTDVLLEMEKKGIRIDLDRLKDCKKNVDSKLAELDKEIYLVPSVIQFQVDCGLTFNPRSSVQLREVLFKYENLVSTKKTEKTKAPSTDRSVLESYRDVSKLCDILCDHSVYSSMKSKMIKELEDHNIDGRIHTHYWVTETGTGRTSSDDPNMQNVTKGKKDVVGIRKVFIADEGYELAELDYNQHEVRCMADVAEDIELYNAAKYGDIHSATAAIILQKKPEDVTSDERRDVGKTFVFGLSYGLTKYGIIKRLGCTDKVAQQYIDRFFGAYKNTKLYMDAVSLFVKENGYVKSRTGRYRRFPILPETNLDEKSIREAINMPIQALAGDILMYSLIGVHNFLTSIQAKTYLCLEVHDSLVLNLHKSERYLLKPIKHIMLTYFKNFMSFNYDLDVDVKVGPDWGSLEEIDV